MVPPLPTTPPVAMPPEPITPPLPGAPPVTPPPPPEPERRLLHSFRPRLAPVPGRGTSPCRGKRSDGRSAGTSAEMASGSGPSGPVLSAASGRGRDRRGVRPGSVPADWRPASGRPGCLRQWSGRACHCCRSPEGRQHRRRQPVRTSNPTGTVSRAASACDFSIPRGNVRYPEVTPDLQ